MRRIIPIICAILMAIAIMSHTNNTNDVEDIEPSAIINKEIDVDIQEPEVIPTIEPVIIPIVEQVQQPVQEFIPEPTPEPTPEPVWWTDYDLDLLAAAIHYEAGSDCCTDEHQQLVGQVVINRKNDPRYPDTVYDVIMDNRYGRQYSTYKLVTDNAGNRDIVSQRCYDNALAVLNGEVECPADVIFQANFEQGVETYKIFKTSYSTTYFCRG